MTIQRAHQRGGEQLLEAEVSRMSVVTGNASMYGWCGQEDHIGAKIVTASFTEIASTARHTRFNSYTIPCDNPKTGDVDRLQGYHVYLL